MVSGNFRFGWLVSSTVALVLAALLLPRLVENLDAEELMVIQSVTGELHCYTDPGPQWQGLGRVTKYPRRATYEFNVTSREKDGSKLPDDTSKQLRFNDGGHADLYGSVNWEMPLDCPSVVSIHKNFGGPSGVASKAVTQMVDTAVYLSGPLMSSTESSGERRSELVQLINDQAQNGAYQMVAETTTKVDPVTREERTTTVARVAVDASGAPRRQQGSVLKQFGLKLLPLSITELRYDRVVEKQIAQRQEATTAVQISQAKARQAAQDAITAEENGKAAAAKAKWEQETIKAKEVTLAQQKLDVSTLAAKEAEQFKREQVLRGEAERKRLVMQADGALDAKLEAYKAVQAAWADAFAKHGGSMVPAVQMGGSVGATPTAAGNAQALVELLTARTAKDLALDLSQQKR